MTLPCMNTATCEALCQSHSRRAHAAALAEAKVNWRKRRPTDSPGSASATHPSATSAIPGQGSSEPCTGGTSAGGTARATGGGTAPAAEPESYKDVIRRTKRYIEVLCQRVRTAELQGSGPVSD
jgi:hypothetical protein